MSQDHLFYEKEIVRVREQERIKKILTKYQNEPLSDELKEKIYNDLVEERHKGNISIPFQLNVKKDASAAHPPYIEVLLDTRV